MAILKKIITWLIVLAIIAALGYAGYGYWQKRQAALEAMAAGRGTSGPVPLPVAGCDIRDMTDYLGLTGTTEALEEVVIRARVHGYLQGIHFDDGAIVEKGQLLFTIEQDAYRARRDEAAARLAAGQTELDRAQQDLDRITRAVETDAVSRQELTRARASYETAKASVMGFQAALDNAELDLSYTQIRSPISGRIARRMVDVGNLVGGDGTALTTVRRTRPIYVSFFISENLLRGELLQRLQGGADAEPLAFFAGLPDGGDYPYEGVINYLDNTVDMRTGTVYVRGEIANADRSLLPGMFVRVRIPVAERRNAILVPERAIASDIGGRYLLVVGEGNVLRRQDVKLGATANGLRVVTEGLDGTEKFVVGGFYMARPGMPILPMTGDAPPEGAGAGGGRPAGME